MTAEGKVQRRRGRAGRVAGHSILYIVLIITSLAMLIPFYWMVITSLKTEANAFSNPPQWWPHPMTFSHYAEVFRIIPNFGRYFLNSIIVSVSITLGQIFFDTLAAYGFAKLKFPGRDTIFFLFLMSMMVPSQINIIPMYKMMGSLHWLDTYWALIVPKLTGVFGIFMMRQFILSIPNELLDAARIDACSEFRIFLKIILPLSVPGIATLAIFTFMGAWNDFLWPQIMTSSDLMYTLPVGLAQLQSKNTSNWTQIMAGTVLSALPLILLYLSMQDKFVEGMTAGAVKE